MEQLTGNIMLHNVTRVRPLGVDREFNKYWFFDIFADELHYGCGRVIVEKKDGNWGYYQSEGHVRRFAFQ
jgi:hypothetical protein